MLIWASEQFNTLSRGDKIRRFYNEGNPNNRLMHVRGSVDGMIVVRWWGKHKQRWNYEVCDRYNFTEWDIVESQ